MKRALVLGLAVGLIGITGVLNAADSSNFALKIVPAASEVAQAGGTVDLSVQLTTTVEDTQGWSFGVLLETDAGVTASITRVARAADVEAVKDGDVADFNTTSYYTAADLANKAGDCEPACDGIDAVGFTQGVVIDFMQKVSLPAVEDFALVDCTVQASGPADGSAARLSFTNELGSPPVQTVAVHGGASIPPATQEGAQITFKEITTAPPASFTIEIQGGEGDTGEEVAGLIVLDFNADGKAEGQEVQGWSYGVCIKDPGKLEIVDATVDGTMTATVKDGDPADFDTVTVYPGQGVTHGVVIDFKAKVTLPAQNDWTDLAVTWKILMDQEGDTVCVAPCDQALGEPPVANVMVIGGASIPASVFEGCDPLDPETGCQDPEACNKPGIFAFVPPPPGNYFIPGSANGDGRLDLADAVYILNALFRGGPDFPCQKAADANNDCVVDGSDAVYIVYYLFLDGPEPPLGTGCQLVDASVCPDLTCEVNECEAP